MDKIIGIYRITNPKNKVYIGQSKDMNHRKTLYKNKQCKGQIKLYNSLVKYGWDNHIFEVIEECNLDELDIKEKEYKTKFINENGWSEALFLMIEDGKGGNKNVSTKIKMALSSAKFMKKVKTYDLEGNFIMEFDSPTHANQVLFPDKKGGTGGILDSCNANPPKSHRGFIFQYSEDDNIKTLLPIIQNNKKIKQLKVFQYDLEDNFIAEYPNSYMVEKSFKEKNIRINSTDVRACCNGKQKTCGGYKWKYGESSLELNKDKYIIDIKESNNNFNELLEQFEEEKMNRNISLSMLKKIIKDNYKGNILFNYNKDIHIFLPDINLGFNIYNLKDLINKSSKHMTIIHKKYLKLNIKLIQIYSDEIINKYDIVESRIMNEFKLISNRIYARKCEIREIENPSIKDSFLKTNHIQGADKSKVKLGLYHNNELVSIMTFNHPRQAMGNKNNIMSLDNTWELLRFCSKLNTNVIGGASKLFKYFIKNYNPSLIYSFADNRWSSILSNVYKAIGFEYISSSNHGYYYTKDYLIRLHRYNFNKFKLKKMGADTENKTELEIMTEKGYHRIWDCGVARYEYIC